MSSSRPVPTSAPLQFEVEVHPYQGKNGLVAFLNLVVNQRLPLRGSSLYRDSNGSFWIKSPAVKGKGKEGETEPKYYDEYFFLEKEDRDNVLNLAVAAYKKAVGE